MTARRLTSAVAIVLHLAGDAPARGEEPFVAEPLADGLFARPDLVEFGSAWSRDGELFYGVDLGERTEIRRRRVDRGIWSEERVVLTHPEHSFNDPFLDEARQRLYFISDRPLDGGDGTKDFDIWFVELDGEAVGEPRRVDEVASEHNEFYVSVSSDGELAFASNRGPTGEGGDYDLYLAAPSDAAAGRLHPPVPVEAANTGAYQGDPLISPDGSFIVYSTYHREGFGDADLYVTFRTAASDPGTGWSPPANLGPVVNGSGKELCPALSPDGRTLLFTRDGDLWRVDVEVVESARQRP